MYIYTNNWERGYLDYAIGKNDFRIKTHIWCVLSEIKGQYFVRKKSSSALLNYLKEVGFRTLLRKVISRLKEKKRNQKYLSCGVGQLLGLDSECKKNVFFIAPNHPECVERIVLPGILVKPLENNEINKIISSLDQNEILYYNLKGRISVDTDLKNIFGWSEFSGIELNKGKTNSILTSLEQKIGAKIRVSKSRKLVIEREEGIKEFTKVNLRYNKELRGVLFGYGHYAKSIILPNISKKIRIAKIHELDPTQIPNIQNDKISYDTSPFPQKDEKYDVYFIASYHHTHAPIAIHALKQGSYVVVEKPLLTTFDQLNRIEDVVRETPGKLFVGFHKRYSQFNTIAYKDLGVNKGDPISYHCIVYEVPLPPIHWYRWPNSCSRLVSNGCHWIDHFLFLNGYSQPVDYGIWKAGNGDLVVYAGLKNGASFSMTLTDMGAPRIGMQEYVELKTKTVSVKIINDSNYLSEDSRKIIRRKNRNKLENYKNMYSTISKKILKGENGDTLKSIQVPWRLILKLEERLRRI